MYTTLNEIRKHGPCGIKPDADGNLSGLRKLIAHLGKDNTDDDPVHIRTILDSNGLDDALWCLRAVAGETRVMRLYAVWCARSVQHLMSDRRSIEALDVAERHAHGDATDEDLAAARGAAWAAAWDAARAVAQAAARAAAWAAAWDASWDAARAAAWDASWDASWGASWGAAWAAARAAARAAQEKELRRVLDCMDAGTDPYPKRQVHPA